jgi:hypothetical protein
MQEKLGEYIYGYVVGFITPQVNQISKMLLKDLYITIILLVTFLISEENHNLYSYLICGLLILG